MHQREGVLRSTNYGLLCGSAVVRAIDLNGLNNDSPPFPGVNAVLPLANKKILCPYSRGHHHSSDGKHQRTAICHPFVEGMNKKDYLSKRLPTHAAVNVKKLPICLRGIEF